MASPVERILARVVTVENNCWHWTGPTSKSGYGLILAGKRKTGIHRVIYEHFKGPIPDGLTIDHLCRNRVCVNPEHLEPVTRGENVLRGIGVTAVNARKTHCKHGHPFSEENTLIKASTGERVCRECHRRRCRDEYQRRRARAGASG